MPRLDVGRFVADTVYSTRLIRAVEEGMIGGFCVFNADTFTATSVLTELQHIVNKQSLPSLIFSCDCEWGLAMRFTGEVNEFPHALALTHSTYTNAIYKAASAIAIQMRGLGLHWNFAPVADVNSNPDNPIINIRSFGEDPTIVAENAIQYFYGLRNNGIIATAKHFPGHGNTKVDSHSALPILIEPASAFDSIELPPFISLIEAGIPSIMTGHLSIPLLAKDLGASDEEAMLPTTVSPFLLHKLLREKLLYEGVIISDSLEMAAINTLFDNESILCEKAIRAGCDVLLMPTKFEEVHKSLIELCKNDDTFFELIAQSNSRINYMIEHNIKASQPSTEHNEETLSYDIAKAAITTNGSLEYIKDAHTYAIVVDDEIKQSSKVELLRSKMTDLFPAIKYIENLTDTNYFPNIVFILQRPRGKLLDESSVASILSPVDRLLAKFADEIVEPDCIILLGNPYLENKLPHCNTIIKTYSDSIPSINGVIDYLAAN